MNNSERLLVSLCGVSVDRPGRQRIIVGYDQNFDPIWRDSGLRVAEHQLFEVPAWADFDHILSLHGVRRPTEGERYSGKVEGKPASVELREKLAALAPAPARPVYQMRDAQGRVVEDSTWRAGAGRFGR
jgi:hypothetical protein